MDKNSNLFFSGSFEDLPGNPLLFSCLREHSIKILEPFVNSNLTKNYLPDGHPDAKTHHQVAKSISSRIAKDLTTLSK